VVLLENGDLLACIYQGELLKLNWDSQVQWIRFMASHHEITMAPNSDIYALDARYETVSLFGDPYRIYNDYISVISQDGMIQKEINLFDILEDKIPRDAVRARKKELLRKERRGLQETYWDIFHNNTISIIDRDLPGFCKKGNVLISAREFDLIGVVDLQQKKLVWTWGPGNLSRQHKPVLLENNNILIYDNGKSRKYSRVIELNPFTEKIEWEYKADPVEDFYSEVGGGSERLPNGNTLIVQEYEGRVFEVTRNGQIVWEYYTPKDPKDNRKRAAIYRMHRITNSQKYEWFKKLKL
jgi:hypothetical protein